MGRNKVYGLLGVATAALVITSCQKSSEEESVAAAKHLYMATGICYAGIGFTAPAVGVVGKTVARFNLSSRNTELIKDYADLSVEVAATWPAGITPDADGNMYVSVEHATAGNKRIDRLPLEPNSNHEVWYQSAAVLTTVMKAITVASDGGIIIGRTTTVDRFDPASNRKTVTATNAWGQAFGGSCATNNTIITSVLALPAYSSGLFSKFVYSHSTAGQHDIGIIGMNGYTVAGDCLANAPGGATLSNSAGANLGWSAQLSATAAPTAMVYVATPGGTATGKLIVAYSSSTLNTAAAAGLSNALVMYDITESSATAATITNGVVLYHDHNYLFGVTAMAYDEDTNELYVAVNNSLAVAPVGYNIEKFAIDLTSTSSTGTGATRVTHTDGGPFMSSNTFNNCVTGMFVK